jgi:hypothetical protein
LVRPGDRVAQRVELTRVHLPAIRVDVRDGLEASLFRIIEVGDPDDEAGRCLTLGQRGGPAAAPGPLSGGHWAPVSPRARCDSQRTNGGVSKGSGTRDLRRISVAERKFGGRASCVRARATSAEHCDDEPDQPRNLQKEDERNQFAGRNRGRASTQCVEKDVKHQQGGDSLLHRRVDRSHQEALQNPCRRLRSVAPVMRSPA